MYECTQFLPFLQTLFDDPGMARKASRITAGIMQGRSPRLSDIAREMSGSEVANYKMIQRFLESIDPQTVLLRMFREEAPFVIGDPTEMPRPQAKKTEYVGTLSDGETMGYWLMILATPYHGPAIPCGFVDYSSRTIKLEATSRNRHHFAPFRQVKELLGERPLVLDREFSYLELLENLVLEGINFVIRLKVGPLFCDGEGKPVALSIQKGETRILNKVFYKGKVFVNVIGIWREGFSEPMWTMANLDAKVGLAIYNERMKIEEAFRDLKSLLNFHKLMNKRRHLMEKMVALILIAYAIVLIVGEACVPSSSRMAAGRTSYSLDRSSSQSSNLSFRLPCSLTLDRLSANLFFLPGITSEVQTSILTGNHNRNIVWKSWYEIPRTPDKTPGADRFCQALSFEHFAPTAPCINL